MSSFVIGDRVTWTSQSKGNSTTKHGVIVAIVPAGSDAMNCIPAGFSCNSTCGYGTPRSHHSYLVQVDGKGKRLYWPVVSLLKKDTGECRRG